MWHWTCLEVQLECHRILMHMKDCSANQDTHLAARCIWRNALLRGLRQADTVTLCVAAAMTMTSNLDQELAQEDRAAEPL